jgi:hypothetical protein
MKLITSDLTVELRRYYDAKAVLLQASIYNFHKRQ